MLFLFAFPVFFLDIAQGQNQGDHHEGNGKDFRPRGVLSREENAIEEGQEHAAEHEGLAIERHVPELRGSDTGHLEEDEKGSDSGPVNDGERIDRESLNQGRDEEYDRVSEPREHAEKEGVEVGCPRHSFAVFLVDGEKAREEKGVDGEKKVANRGRGHSALL